MEEEKDEEKKKEEKKKKIKKIREWKEKEIKEEESTELGLNGTESQIYVQYYVDYTHYRHKKKDLL